MTTETLKERRTRLEAQAERVGLCVFTRNSGNGYTAYRFRTIDEKESTYFHSNFGVHTAYGLTDAENWLRGWIDCWYNSGYAVQALNQTYSGYWKFEDEDGNEYGSFQVFEVDADNPDLDIPEEDRLEPGWYWWACFEGCIPDGEPSGPFNNAGNAYRSAMRN